MENDLLTIGLAQIAPVWLNKSATIDKIIGNIEKASEKNCQLVTFGEALLPGYPFWIERTNGARFNSKMQKEFHALYLKEAVQIENGDLDSICKVAREKEIAVMLGTIELAKDRGNHSVYCSLVYINQLGEIKTVHRKLMPTYEERLSWAQGDGHGLRVHSLGAFTVGGLNCWENWIPMARTALYGMGEDLHIAIWPGGSHNTNDITKFIAKESRSYVVSVSGLMRKSDITEDIPFAEEILQNSTAFLANGASCVASPTGEWVLEPQLEKEDLFVVTLDHKVVREERHNFDPSGHYSRPDVLQLHVNRDRQCVVNIED